MCGRNELYRPPAATGHCRRCAGDGWCRARWNATRDALRVDGDPVSRTAVEYPAADRQEARP